MKKTNALRLNATGPQLVPHGHNFPGHRAIGITDFPDVGVEPFEAGRYALVHFCVGRHDGVVQVISTR